MSVFIGIDFCRIVSEIAVYDEKLDNIEIRIIEDSNLKKIIFNLKNEFQEKLSKVFILTDKNVCANISVTGKTPLCFFSKKDLNFTHHLSGKSTLDSKLIEFICTSDSNFGRNTVKCILYSFTTLDKEVLQTEQIKYLETRYDVENFHEILFHEFNLKSNESHAITYKSDAKNKCFVEKLLQKKKFFCSFTIMESRKLRNAYKAIIYGRYLLKDEKIQSFINLQPYSDQSTKNSVIETSGFVMDKLYYFITPRSIDTYKSQTRLMGIDLGTTRCVVCISRNGRTDLVKIDQDYSMPTFISFAEEKPIIGSIAMKKLKNQSKSILYDFKSVEISEELPKDFEQFWPFKICKTSNGISFVVYSQDKITSYSSIEIYEIVLQKLKMAASEYQFDFNQGEPVNQAVITVPCISDKKLIARIMKAADLAGIEIVDIIEETHADLLYCLSENNSSIDQNFIVIDIGGGTGYIHNYKKNNENERKGFSSLSKIHVDFWGRKIDQMLLKKLKKFLLQEYKINIYALKHYEMLLEIERIKHILSFEKTAHLNLPSTVIQMDNPPQVSRKWFEQEVLEPLLLRGRVKETVKTYNERHSSMKFGKITKVFLVGGTCRIPYVQNLFKTIFGEEKVVIDGELEMITATGALIHGLQILSDDAKSVLRDSKSLSFATNPMAKKKLRSPVS